MPVKIFMNLNNPAILHKPANLGVLPKAPNSLKSSIIARIHNVRPGCGSCGR